MIPPPMHIPMHCIAYTPHCIHYPHMYHDSLYQHNSLHWHHASDALASHASAYSSCSLPGPCRQAGFIKQLMAEQQRHVSCFGDGRNRTHAVTVKSEWTLLSSLPYPNYVKGEVLDSWPMHTFDAYFLTGQQILTDTYQMVI
jgi:hypothetical protein